MVLYCQGCLVFSGSLTKDLLFSEESMERLIPKCHTIFNTLIYRAKSSLTTKVKTDNNLNFYTWQKAFKMGS